MDKLPKGSWYVKTEKPGVFITNELCQHIIYWEGFRFPECEKRSGFRCRAICCPLRAKNPATVKERD